jgi:hypothetical protein
MHSRMLAFRTDRFSPSGMVRIRFPPAASQQRTVRLPGSFFSLLGLPGRRLRLFARNHRRLSMDRIRALTSLWTAREKRAN